MSLMKIALTGLAAALLFAGCSPTAAQTTAPQAAEAAPSLPELGPKNTVIVLGMIHRQHTTSKLYGLDVVEAVIREINPDYVLTEIPPDRFGEAVRGFTADGVVSEPRTRVFPEYKDVLFPLSTDMDFAIIPTAAWTQGMVDIRRKGLNAVREDASRAEDWAAYQAENKAYSDAIAGRRDDPIFIHSDEYDKLTKAGFQAYATRFADDLGRGDWESINAGHYKLIESALENHSGEGATILITYGAAHKYWFLEQLRKREDIILVNPTEYFEELEGE